MNWVVIKGLGPLDGRYELDLRERDYTNREARWFKVYAGYTLPELDSRAVGDPDFHSVLAMIVLHRAGKIQEGDIPGLWKQMDALTAGSVITADDDPEETVGDADGPPPISSTSSGGSSSESSRNGSESSGSLPSRTGAPASDTSVSVPATSAG